MRQSFHVHGDIGLTLYVCYCSYTQSDVMHYMQNEQCAIVLNKVCCTDRSHLGRFAEIESQTKA